MKQSVADFVGACDGYLDDLADAHVRLRGVLESRYPLRAVWAEFKLLHHLRDVFAAGQKILVNLQQYVRDHPDLDAASLAQFYDFIDGLNARATGCLALLPDRVDRNRERFYDLRRYLRNLIYSHWGVVIEARKATAPLSDALADAPMALSAALQNLRWLTAVFVSYAHEDSVVVVKLVGRLKPRIEEEFVFFWRDSEILHAGDPWSEEIDKQLETLDCAFALTSPYFATSEFIRSKELRRFVERHNLKEARLFAARLAACECDSDPDLKLIQWFPSGDRYILNGATDLTDEDLAAFEADLAREILYNIAVLSDAGGSMHYLLDKLERAAGPAPALSPG